LSTRAKSWSLSFFKLELLENSSQSSVLGTAIGNITVLQCQYKRQKGTMSSCNEGGRTLN